MSPFEFLFSLFGLLLGFTLVEILAGLVRTAKARGRWGGEGEGEGVRIGWLTPLLGLFVLLDIASYWVNVWAIRDVVPVGLDTVFAGTAIAGAYYFAASMIFPADLNASPDLDAWFWRHRRQVLVCLIVVNAVWIFGTTALHAPPVPYWVFLAFQAAYFLPLAIAAWAKNRWVVGAMLTWLSVVYLGFAVFDLLRHLRS